MIPNQDTVYWVDTGYPEFPQLYQNVSWTGAFKLGRRNIDLVLE